jgi:hypothetical protein
MRNRERLEEAQAKRGGREAVAVSCVSRRHTGLLQQLPTGNLIHQDISISSMTDGTRTNYQTEVPLSVATQTLAGFTVGGRGLSVLLRYCTAGRDGIGGDGLLLACCQ